MIDLGRRRDLESFNDLTNNIAQPASRRRAAYRVMQGVRKKMRDPQILKMRLRLIAATVKNDLLEIAKLSDRLNDYEQKHYPARRFTR